MISVHRGTMDGWTFGGFRGDEGYSFFRAGAGSVYSMYRAHNRTSPSKDPRFNGLTEEQRRRTENTHSPMPNGVFEVSQPIFFKPGNRDEVYSRRGWTPERGESTVGGWSGGWEWDEGEPYNIRMGQVRFRVGAPRGDSASLNRIAWNREIFIHGGRYNGNARTWGCIRMFDDDIDNLASDFIALNREGDPVTHLFVQD